MRIGLDFDNTIVNYDGVFHAAAIERGLIVADVPKDKNAVRDYLNGSGRSGDFTELQGYVYGARMDLARPYEGVSDFVAAARAAGHDVFVVSHKTRRPILGSTYDMHNSARVFLHSHGLLADRAIPAGHIFFEETRQEKVGRVAALELDAFVDDLPEILLMPGLPEHCRRILFAPGGAAFPDGCEVYRSWRDISACLLDRPS